MVYRQTPFAPGEFYHIYNRGNSKQNIFKDEGDKTRFQELLYLANTHKPISIKDARYKGVYNYEREVPLVGVGAYCLMSNHFHILLTPVADMGVSKFLKKLMTGYVMYFNKKYERSGGLFEGVYKSKYIDTDEYLKYIYSYIHLNPVRSKLSNRSLSFAEAVINETSVKEYKYSSYIDYINDNRNEAMILTKDLFPEYFTNSNQARGELLEWLQFTPEV